MADDSVMSMEDYFNGEAGLHDELFVQRMGMTEFYDEVERRIERCPQKRSILVSGCGTGLEIERIGFRAHVTAVDIADSMLDKLREKKLHRDVTLTTRRGSLLDLDFGGETFDLVVACYVMHHFSPEQKALLYGKICRWLTPEGTFLCGDTMAQTPGEEQKRLQEARRIYGERGLPFASLHIDAPLHMDHERELLEAAGFAGVVVEREWTATKLYRAVKR